MGTNYKCFQKDKMQFPPIENFSFISEIRASREIGSCIFLSGCNFRCPYCINRELINIKESKIDPIDIISRFQLRMENVVVISGGEPFLHDGIFNLLFALKTTGFKVAVATNGSFPEKIVEAAENGIIDHVILDVKTRLEKKRYEQVIGRKMSHEEFHKILFSIEYLLNGPSYKPSCEFRTTTCLKFVNRDDLDSIADYLGKNAFYVLQPFAIHQTLDESIAKEEYIVPYETLSKWSKELNDKVFSCYIRDV